MRQICGVVFWSSRNIGKTFISRSELLQLTFSIITNLKTYLSNFKEHLFGIH